MNAFFKWIVLHLAGWLHSFSASDLSAAIDLVVKAQAISADRAEKLKWFIDAFLKINSAFKATHEDGTPTNGLNLLVSLAKELAQKFGLIK